MRFALLCLLFPCLLLLCTPAALTMPRAEGDCTITLGTDPEPPECVPNPDGTVTMFWNVEHSTTPDFVYYELTNPDGDTVENELYPGDTGTTITRDWTVPAGSLEGAYWVHVEYWSVEVGIEGVAEVVFLVCGATPTEPDTWGHIKGLFRR